MDVGVGFRRAVVWACVLVLNFAGSAAHAAVGRTVGNYSVSTSGAAQYSVPLWTPPGINGIQPTLSLAYSSRAGTGYFGVGWMLEGLSEIQRCPKTWAQDGVSRDVRNDSEDRFCLDGSRLKSVAGTYGASGAEYRTEVETFARIKSYGAAGTGPAYFVVERKNGLIFEYGNSEDARIESIGQATARAWALNKVTDRSGNAMLFSYTEDTANGSYRISGIQYTQNNNAGVSPHYEVNFVYEDVPPGEVDTAYLANSKIARAKRADRIDVMHDGALVRRYELTYEPMLSSTSRSRLASIQECAGASDCFPPSRFTYQNGSPGVSAEITTQLAVPVGSHPWPLDVNGDGRQDLVFPSSTKSGAGTWIVAFADASGGYSTPINTGISNANWNGAIPIDYDADGREDLLVPYAGGTWWVMQGTASGFASPIDTGVQTTATGTGSNARAIDIDGDGLQDLVWADLTGNAGGDAIRYRLRALGGTFSSDVTTLVGPLSSDDSLSNVFTPIGSARRADVPDFNGDGRGDLTYQRTLRTPIDGTRASNYARTYTVYCPGGTRSGFSVDATSSALYFGDFNGDGRDDLLYFKGGTRAVTVVRYSTGTSFTGEVPLAVGASYELSYIVSDWDGDGLDDLLLPNRATSTWDVFRSTGEGFAQPAGTGISAGAGSDITVADATGDGLPDIAYNVGGVWHLRARAGAYPDLLLSATDGFGIGASFTYVPIAQNNYTKLSDATFPEQDYQGPLYVVSNVAVSSGVASPATYSQSFWYSGARVNRQGRGFEGFAARRTTDSRNSLVSLQSFKREFPFTGLTQQADELQPDGATLITRSVNTFGVKTFGEGAATRQFPYVASSTRDAYEVGGARNAQWISRETTTVEVDDYGTPISLLTTIQDKDALSPGYDRAYSSHITRVVENHSASWCLGRSTQTIVENTLPDGTSATRTQSASIDSAACRVTQQVLEPNSATLNVTTDYGFDACGNVHSVRVAGKNPDGTDMPSRNSSMDYGSRCQFPIAQTNALSETSEWSWDYSLGLRTAVVDANGIRTSWQHDSFGRSVRENRAADGTYSIWTPELCSDNPSACYHRLVRRDYGTDGKEIKHQSVFFDALDRPVGKAYDNAFGAEVDQRLAYDALGRLVSVSAPFFAADGKQHFTTFEFDWLNRPTRETREVSDADSSSQTVSTFYEGLTTRLVDAQNKQVTRTATVVGQLASVRDHSGDGQNFLYDAFGDPTQVRDTADKTLQSNVYNTLGMRTASIDVDMGKWTYAYNSLGELISQVDANSKTTSFTYDALSRPLTRTEPDGGDTITYTYKWGINRPDWAQVKGATIRDNRQVFSYDAAGRLVRTTYTDLETATDYNVDQSYSAITGLLDTLTYPTSTSKYRLKLQYDYQNGQPYRVSDFNDPSNVFWQAYAADAFGNVTDEALGNGLRTTRSFDAITGWIGVITTDASDGRSIQHLSYQHDKVGNVIERQDLRQNLTERFVYDDLSRLDYSTLNGVTHFDVSYDAQGNITAKSRVGAYGYDQSKIHALTTIDRETAFTYDANGNALGDPRVIAFSYYTSNLPKTANWMDGGYSSTFSYGPDQQRFFQSATFPRGRDSILYIGGLLEKESSGAKTTWKHYIFTPCGRTALYTRESNDSNQTYYFTHDLLGSIDSITNARGNIEVRLSYDAHGWRRNEAGWSGAVPKEDWHKIYAISHRGFTDHEMLDDVDVIHMNGRIYDPYSGRFVSPDPLIQAPLDTQSFNRYSYVRNNPLRAIDPSGFAQLDIDAINGNESVIITGGLLSGWSAGAALFGGTHRADVDLVPRTVGGHGGAGRTDTGAAGSVKKPRAAHIEIDCSPGLFICDNNGFKKWEGPSEEPVDGLWDDIFYLSLSAPRAIGTIGSRVLANRMATYGVADSAGVVTNVVPKTLARVTSGTSVRATLGPPSVPDVFVTAADDIAGLNATQLAEKLAIPSSGRFTIVEFPTPAEGLASPVFRTNPGFIGGGLTGGGAREFVIPNGPIPPGATVRIVGP